jgi:hypothetical protein
MIYSSDEIAALNEVSTLKRRITELEEENDQLQGQVEGCRMRIETCETELRRNR